jgi:hypothetical protein
MTVAESEFNIGDAVKIKESAWEVSYPALTQFGFKRDAIYEVSGVYPNRGISLVGNTRIYYPYYFEVSSSNMIQSKEEAEHTGGSVNYYKVHVANPTTLPEAYDAEANDIIESLGLTFAEGNLFKAIWRMAADRNGKKKKGNNSVYDAEKLVFFAERVLVQEKAKHESE